MVLHDSKYYIALDEEEPFRTCKSKRFILKIMLLAAIAQPHWDHVREEIWDGKLGILPFTIPKATKRSNKNCPCRTLETKVIMFVTNKEMANMVCSQLMLAISAISAKWPCPTSHNIGMPIVGVQQDNAKPHIKATDQSFVDAVVATRMDIS